MKLLVQRAFFLVVLLIGFALVLQTVVTAQPNADIQLYLPLVSLQPTDTPTPTVTPSPTPNPILHLGPFGGSGGSAFEDSVPSGSYVTSVIIHAGDGIDNVQMVLNTGALPAHGGGGGDYNQLNLNSGEYITEIDGSYGAPPWDGWSNIIVVRQISIKTNQHTFGPYGKAGDTGFTIQAPAGYAIVGFFGQAGAVFVDKLGAIARPH